MTDAGTGVSWLAGLSSIPWTDCAVVEGSCSTSGWRTVTRHKTLYRVLLGEDARPVLPDARSLTACRDIISRHPGVFQDLLAVVDDVGRVVGAACAAPLAQLRIGDIAMDRRGALQYGRTCREAVVASMRAFEALHTGSDVPYTYQDASLCHVSLYFEDGVGPQAPVPLPITADPARVHDDFCGLLHSHCEVAQWLSQLLGHECPAWIGVLQSLKSRVLDDGHFGTPSARDVLNWIDTGAQDRIAATVLGDRGHLDAMGLLHAQVLDVDEPSFPPSGCVAVPLPVVVPDVRLSVLHRSVAGKPDLERLVERWARCTRMGACVPKLRGVAFRNRLARCLVVQQFQDLPKAAWVIPLVREAVESLRTCSLFLNRFTMQDFGTVKAGPHGAVTVVVVVNLDHAGDAPCADGDTRLDAFCASLADEVKCLADEVKCLADEVKCSADEAR